MFYQIWWGGMGTTQNWWQNNLKWPTKQQYILLDVKTEALKENLKKQKQIKMEKKNFYLGYYVSIHKRSGQVNAQVLDDPRWLHQSVCLMTFMIHSKRSANEENKISGGREMKIEAEWLAQQSADNLNRKIEIVQRISCPFKADWSKRALNEVTRVDEEGWGGVKSRGGDGRKKENQVYITKSLSSILTFNVYKVRGAKHTVRTMTTCTKILIIQNIASIINVCKQFHSIPKHAQCTICRS